MKIKLHLEGTVNGHAFTIQGKGEGNPHEWVNLALIILFSFKALKQVQTGGRVFFLPPPQFSQVPGVIIPVYVTVSVEALYGD